jgi:2-isopropylmalate synthase
LECGASFVGLFFCLTDERMKDLNCDLPQAVRRITELVAFAREKKPDLWIRYTPEDTVRSSWETVTAVAAEAVRAGADIISIADTTGRLIPGTPHNMYDWVSRLKEALAGKNLFPRFAVHCHNDRGLAVANALDGFRAGADIIDVSVLGLGERAGIADLASLLALFNQDFASGKPWKLEKIPELYRIVSRYAGVPIPVHFPVVGRNAFTHCAGVHTQAALKNPLHYQSLDPLPFGRRPEIALDHMSGQAALQHSLERIGQADLPKEFLGEILLKVKAVGQTGRAVDLEELEWIVKYQKEKWGLIEET